MFPEHEDSGGECWIGEMMAFLWYMVNSRGMRNTSASHIDVSVGCVMMS